MDLTDDLARFEVEEIDLDQPPPTLDGQHAVDKLLGVIRRIDRRTAEVLLVAEAERERIGRWEDEQTDRLQRQRQHLLRSVEQFMRAHHAATQAVSLTLSNGTLKLPLNQTSVLVPDPNKAVTWLQANGHATAVTYYDPPAPRPAANEVKKLVGEGKPLAMKATTELTAEGRTIYQLVTAEGEVVPGVQITKFADERGFGVTLADEPEST